MTTEQDTPTIIEEGALPPPESFVPVKGSIGERTDAQVEADAIDQHIKRAGELLEGSALNVSSNQVALSIAHSLNAFVLMMRRTDRDQP